MNTRNNQCFEYTIVVTRAKNKKDPALALFVFGGWREKAKKVYHTRTRTHRGTPCWIKLL